MDFRERVPFGRTGLMVSRIGLAPGGGVPTAAIEKAFHDRQEPLRRKLVSQFKQPIPRGRKSLDCSQWT
jgi:hypothetical protein